MENAGCGIVMQLSSNCLVFDQSELIIKNSNLWIIHGASGRIRPRWRLRENPVTGRVPLVHNT
ncbi:MAG: hypothetical protein V5A42_00140 [Halofilum sp. (in: g-proteobacteria)]